MNITDDPALTSSFEISSSDMLPSLVGSVAYIRLVFVVIGAG